MNGNWSTVDTVLPDLDGPLTAERTSAMIHKRVCAALLIGCAPFALAGINELVVDLPAEVEWTMLVDEETDGTYHREWIPAGTTVDDTDLWLIVSQKLDLEKRRSARRFLMDMRKLARTACTDLLYHGPKKSVTKRHMSSLYSGPKKVVIEKFTSYWGGFFCARWQGEEYGTVTEQRVFADGKTVFVVTSELRIPPTREAGMLPFETRKAVAAFLERMQASSSVVHDAIVIVPAP